jgi:hypothetical protein
MLQIATGLCEPYSSGDVERDKAVQNVVNRLRVGNLWIGRTFLRENDTSSLDSSLVKSPDRLAVLRQAAKGLPWNLGDLPSHLVNERLRQAAQAAGVSCGTADDWKKAVSTALKGLGAKSHRSRQSDGRLVWAWSLQPDVQPPVAVEGGGSTSNVVNFTGENKDLAARAEGEGLCRTN